jgi:hypothetical protein
MTGARILIGSRKLSVPPMIAASLAATEVNAITATSGSSWSPRAEA